MSLRERGRWRHNSTISSTTCGDDTVTSPQLLLCFPETHGDSVPELCYCQGKAAASEHRTAWAAEILRPGKDQLVSQVLLKYLGCTRHNGHNNRLCKNLIERVSSRNPKCHFYWSYLCSCSWFWKSLWISMGFITATQVWYNAFLCNPSYFKNLRTLFCKGSMSIGSTW